MSTLFANTSAVTRSWYLITRSSAIRAGQVRSFELGSRRLAIYRDDQGKAHAVDARCPHLGADLAQGTVEGEAIRCAFHRWKFGADGACVEAPGHGTLPRRRARTYPVAERWGCLWVFNGESPLFELPTAKDDDPWRALVLPPQQIQCHPHVVLANGLDVSHYETLHGMHFSEPPRLSTNGRFEVSVQVRGRPRSRFWQIVSGTTRADLTAGFTTIGSSLAWVTVTAPIRFHVIFTARPDRDGRCITRTIFLVRRTPSPEWVRALALMGMLLHDDRRVLDAIQFQPAFSDADAPMRAFARVVDSLGSW